MRPNRKARRAAKFVGVERGFGPRHAFNAAEGSEAVPSPLPEPPPEEYALKVRRNSLGNLRPALLAKGLAEELGGLSKEDVAKLGISMLMGGEGPEPVGVPPSAKVKQPGLKFHDPHPRYEGPPEGLADLKQKFGEHITEDDVGAYHEQMAKLDQINEKLAAESKQNSLKKQFPSLNKPPYDALKEPGITDEEMFDAMAGYKSPHGELKPETWHPKWEDLPDDVKREYPNPDIMTETDWAKIKEHLDQPPKQKYTHWMGEPVPEAKDPSFSPEEVQKMEDLKDFLKPPKEPPAGQNWLDEYMKKADEQGLVSPSPQQLQDALDALKLPPNEPNVPRYARGVRRVPKTVTGRPRKIGLAKGFGPRHAENAKEGEDLTQVNTDTVPAMLTPREAVLNRNAAELAGRGNIEQLNEQGNELAKKGVDLASGESNIPDPKASDRRLAGTGAASYLTRQLLEKYGGSPTAFELVPDFVKYLQQESDPTMAQRGTANMKPKPKPSPSKPKSAPKPVKPPPPQSGSPYVQGFQGLQGGGYADALPGVRDFPHPMAGKMHPNASLPGYGASLPPDGAGLQPYLPPGAMTGGPEPYQGANRDFPHPNAGFMHPGGPYAGGGSDPYAPGLPSAGGAPGVLGEGFRNFPHPNAGLMHPGGGVLGEPPGGYGAQGLGNLPQQSGSFYPQIPGGKKWGQYAGGATDIQSIGNPAQQQAYGPPIQLSAPDLANILQKAGQQNGLSPSQIAGLSKAFQGFQSGFNELSGGPGSSADMATAASGAYQGGISDIGYPPGIAPRAEFSYEEGGWTGPLDPRWSSPGYARGTGNVDFFGEGFDPSDLGINTGPRGFGPPSTIASGGYGGTHHGGFSNRSSYNPGAWSGGAPGFPWSPTKIPTTYDPQGYPYAVPVQGPDQNVQGVGRTHNLRSNQ